MTFLRNDRGGQTQAKPTAFPNGGLYFDAAAQTLRRFPDYGQPDTRARKFLRGMEPLEQTEDPFALLGGNANAVVPDPKVNISPHDFGGNFHDRASTRNRKFQGVPHQVAEHLIEEEPIRQHRWQRPTAARPCGRQTRRTPPAGWPYVQLAEELNESGSGVAQRTFSSLRTRSRGRCIIRPSARLVGPAVAAVRAIAESLCTAARFPNAVPQMPADFVQLVTSLAQRARAASFALATAPASKKDAALEKLADLIDASHFELMEANQRDLLSPEAGGLSPAARERLTLDDTRLRQLANSVREVVALPDPVGEMLEETSRPNGLRIRKVRVPIGVIGIIYEARPNVTIDCAVLCLKSGNASILRGGKESFHTNMALAALISQALVTTGLPGDAVQLVPTTDRAALATLLKLDSLIQCIIPRGGESLIRYVAENSTIPVIKHYKGICFVYVDAAADLAMAEAITVNAKASRPSVCNAAEQLLVHRAIAEQFLPPVGRALAAKRVQLRCDPASAAILQRAQIPTTAAAPADFSTEFLDYILAIRVVDSLDAAISTINRDSSNHSDAIVTADEKVARRFLAEVDSATVYWNASTRFTDGFEFGYGAEIGISTDRLHARGPMGLRELCSYKFLIEGTGQVRA